MNYIYIDSASKVLLLVGPTFLVFIISVQNSFSEYLFKEEHLGAIQQLRKQNFDYLPTPSKQIY